MEGLSAACVTNSTVAEGVATCLLNRVVVTEDSFYFSRSRWITAYAVHTAKSRYRHPDTTT